jgi:hypothetical protein
VNWIQIFINSVVTACLIAIVGWAVRRWIINVDANLRKMLDQLHCFDIKLAEMPGKYVMKQDCQNAEKNNSDKRANIWTEFNKVKSSYAERLTKIETKMEGTGA